MNDKSVSATTVAAAAGWVVSLGLVLADLFWQTRTGQLGIVVAAGAATVTVRGFFCQLHGRELNAFMLGREYEEHSRVRSIK